MSGGASDENQQPAWLAIIIALIGGIGGVSALILYLLGQGNKAPKAVIEVMEPPRAATNNRLSVFAGMELEFDAYDSEDPEDGNNLKTVWQLKRGNEILEEVKRTMEFRSAPLEVGSYSLILTVEDSKGRKHSDRYRIDVTKGTQISLVEPTGNSNVSETNEEDVEGNIAQVESEPSVVEDYWKNWWQPWNARKGMPPEDEALIVSLEEGEPLFLCRALDEGMWKPGKVLSEGECDVPRYSIKDNTIDSDPNARLSIPVPNYEIFVPQGAYIWVSPTDETESEYIVSTDEDANSIVCRMEYGQRTPENRFRLGKHPGILDQDVDHCVFPWGERAGYLDIEGRSDTYEILVINPDTSP